MLTCTSRVEIGRVYFPTPKVDATIDWSQRKSHCRCVARLREQKIGALEVVVSYPGGPPFLLTKRLESRCSALWDFVRQHFLSSVAAQWQVRLLRKRNVASLDVCAASHSFLSGDRQKETTEEVFAALKLQSKRHAHPQQQDGAAGRQA